MERGQLISTCIGRGRDEKIRRCGLQFCFGLFVLYKKEHLKDATNEARASRVKDAEKLLDAFVIVEVGWFDVDPSLLSKMEVFIKKECVVGRCELEKGGTLSHFHMQMVVDFHISSLKMLKKVLKERLG
jgi:hypothetical protein